VTLDELTALGRPVPEHRPMPRTVVDAAAWVQAGEALRDGQWTLVGLWGDDGAVHTALLEEPTRQLAGHQP